MDPKTVKIKTQKEPHAYEIVVGDDLLKNCGEWAMRCLPANTKKIAIFSDPYVSKIYGGIVEKALRKAGFKTEVFPMPMGEKYKDIFSIYKLLSQLGNNNLTRSDAILALGGGVVGDMAGFAASIYLRGIPFLQIPTTLLAQIDSSVGGKTGVNTAVGKNLVGTFYQPHGVLIDVDVLQTLHSREFTAGLCEAVKQALVAGGPLFEQTRTFLERFPVTNVTNATKVNKFKDSEFKVALAALIRSQVAFKAKIVAGDPKESLSRQDQRSRKILNFGHTTAHALEKVTKYQPLRHGEAVGYGILVAGELSKSLGIFTQDSLKSLKDVVKQAGPLPVLGYIRAEEIHRATIFDKKNSGGVVNWVLLKEIGQPVIIGDDQIPAPLIKKAIRTILK